MTALNDVYDAINSNDNLQEPIKINFMELITIFHRSFKEVDLTNFMERIKTLNIERGSKYLINTECEYLPKDNTIYTNASIFELKKADAKHSLMKAVLAVITAKDHYYGFNESGKTKGFNLAFTDMLADLLVGNDTELNENILDEGKKAINALNESNSTLVLKLLEAYFNNNEGVMVSALANNMSVEEANELCELVNNSLNSNSNIVVSNLIAVLMSKVLKNSEIMERHYNVKLAKITNITLTTENNGTVTKNKVNSYRGVEHAA